MLGLICWDASRCNESRLLVSILDGSEELLEGRKLCESSLMNVDDFAEDSVVVDKIRHFLKQIEPIILSIRLYCFMFLEELGYKHLILHSILIDLKLTHLLLDVPA